MGRRPNTEIRRAQIADGLKQVMAREGFDKASVAAVARAAGLAPGLVHYHFRTKREILGAVLDRIVAQVEARLAATVTAAEWIDAMLGLDGGDPEAVACWVQMGAAGARWPEIAERRAAAVQRLHADLAARVRDPGRATAILCAIEGAYQLAFSTPNLMAPGAAAGLIRALLPEGKA